MKIYKIKGAGFVTATNPQELVEILNNTSMFGYRKRIEDFMKETSKACRIQNGSKIRATSPDVFVKDLLHNNFLEEQQNA